MAKVLKTRIEYPAKGVTILDTGLFKSRSVCPQEAPDLYEEQLDSWANEPDFSSWLKLVKNDLNLLAASKDKTQAKRAKNALYLLDAVQKLISKASDQQAAKNIADWSLKLGRILLQISLRDMEWSTMVGRGKIQGIEKVRPNKRSSINLRKEAEKALLAAKKGYPNRGKIFQIDQAAKSLRISRSAIYARLKKT